MNGTPKIDELTIRTITDGSSWPQPSRAVQQPTVWLTKAIRCLKMHAYTFSQISTSRCFFGKMNFDEKSVCADPAVRKAIAMGIDKENLLQPYWKAMVMWQMEYFRKALHLVEIR